MGSEAVGLLHLKTKLNAETFNYQHILQQTHNQALLQNGVETARWEGYKKDHVELNSRLLGFRDSLSHQVMVPLGRKALMRGQLVHTNEILVCLGDSWFAKQSAKQASEICQRRIQHSDEVLIKLERERVLLTSRTSLPLEKEVFGATDTEEIIEPYDEEEERKWKERHRQKEKEYRQKLAELKNQSSKIETEEDLWKRLDALDLQEDLEDELNRLNEEEEDEEESEESEEDEELSENEAKNYDTGQRELSEEINNKHKLKRRVSFKESFESELNEQTEPTEEEVLRINFKHSEEPSFVSKSREGEINNPSDIHSQYLRQKAPKSILKPSSSTEMLPNPSQNDGQINVAAKYSKAVKHKEVVPELQNEPVVQAVGEVVERSIEAPVTVTNDQRPVSRFKANRLAKR